MAAGRFYPGQGYLHKTLGQLDM